MQLLGNSEEPEPELVDLEKNSLEANKENIDEDMSSQLNPDAKEFVPVSPVRSNPQSPLEAPINMNGASPALLNPKLNYFNEDVIAQSPRKGQPMDNITIPPEDDFDREIKERPHEVEKTIELLSGGDFNRPESALSQGSYQEMNLKEAMHGDEKLELNEDSYKVALEQEMESPQTPKVVSESDPMNMSFYQDKMDESSPFDLNAVQTLPVDEIESESFENDELNKSQQILLETGERIVIEDSDFGMNDNQIASSIDDAILKPEEDMYSPVTEENNIQVESDKPESEIEIQAETETLIDAARNVVTEISSFLDTVSNEPTQESPSDLKYEAENFVEDIKSTNTFEKYVDSGLASEFEPIDKLACSLPEADEIKIADSAESDSCLKPVTEQEQNIDESEEFLAFKRSMETTNTAPPVALSEPVVEQRIATPEPEKSINVPAHAHLTAFEAAIADTVTTLAAETMVMTQPESHEKPIADVPATTEPVIAVTEVKKAETKPTKLSVSASKTTTKPTTTAAKKPTTAPTKSTVPPKSSVTSKTSTTATASAAAKPKITGSPRAAPAEKKPLSSSSSAATAAKKPSASTTSTVRKTTTSTTSAAAPPKPAAAKPASGTIKPAARTSVTATKTSTTVAPKAAVPSATPRTTTAAKVSATTK